jgi:hypothetical protein
MNIFLLRYFCLSSDLKVFASFLPDEMMEFGMSQTPALIFFRDGSPVPYEGKQGFRLKILN